MLTVIFDFDGVLADSFSTALATVNHYAEQFQFRKVQPADIEFLKGLNSMDIIKHLKIPLFKLPRILAKVRSDLNGRIFAVYPGIREALKKIQYQGFALGILSSNAVNNVNSYLKFHGMEYFNFIYGGSSLFGKAKRLKKILKQHGISPQQALYVGDETRDIEAAKLCGMRCVAVTWGLNSAAILKKYSPDYLIDHPDELPKLLKGLAE